MGDKTLDFFHPQTDSIVSFSSKSISTMMKYQQHDGKGKEAGGQLFAQFNAGVVNIEFASKPKSGDRRWWNRFIPCRKAERREIASNYQKGLHFVGDWHTHPELIPKYSRCDLTSIRDCLERSRHDLLGLLLVIVGHANDPVDAIRVWFVNQNECTLMKN